MEIIYLNRKSITEIHHLELVQFKNTVIPMGFTPSDSKEYWQITIGHQGLLSLVLFPQEEMHKERVIALILAAGFRTAGENNASTIGALMIHYLNKKQQNTTN